MYVAALRVELRVPNVHSLKEKRAIVKSIVAHIGQPPAVAAAEVDHHDLWQRATVGVAAVAPQHAHLERLLHSIERDVRMRPDVEVLSVDRSYVEDPG